METGGAGGRGALLARRVVAAVLIVVTGLLAVTSVLSSYVRRDLLDTDRFTALVAPLANSPAVQDQVVDLATAAVVDNVSLAGLSADALAVLKAGDSRLSRLLASDRRLGQSLDALLAGLGPLLQNQLEEVTRRQAQRVVSSPRFAATWAGAVRVAHQQALVALRDEGGVIRTGAGSVRIDLGAIVAEVKARLQRSGFSLANRIPTVAAEIVVVDSPQLAQAQQALGFFDRLAPWAPWVTLLVAAAAVAVAPARRRTLLGVAAAVGVGMVALAIGVALVEPALVRQVAGLSASAATALVDAVAAPLWPRIWLLGLLAALVVVGALLAGPVGAPVRARLRRPVEAPSPP